MLPRQASKGQCHVLTIPELLIRILEYLSHKDVLSASLVCKSWTNLANDVNWRFHPVKLSKVVEVLAASRVTEVSRRLSSLAEMS